MDSELFEMYLDDNLKEEDWELKDKILGYFIDYVKQYNEDTSRHPWDCKCWQCR